MTLRRSRGFYKRKGSKLNLKGILDNYESNIYRAYGFIDYFTSYNGPCIRVSSSEDTPILGSETDIGFINGVINENELLDVANGGSLYIHTFYDLSGNGRDSLASSVNNYRKRARIVNNGLLEKYNLKPSPFFQSPSIAYNFSSDMLPELTSSTIIYIHDLVRTLLHIKIGQPITSTKFGFVSESGSTNTTISSTSILPGNTLRANKTSFSGSNRNDVHTFLTGKKIVSEFNFQISSGNTTGWHFANYGGAANGNFLDGSLPVMLLWKSNLGTTIIDQIMDILNDYYQVY